MTSYFKIRPLSAALFLAMAGQSAQAQNPDNAAGNRPNEDLINEVVVTGRAGAGELRRTEASYAISTLSEDDLLRNNPLSVADVLNAVPGFWVESSGGEASNNIRARGIPRDGYSSVSLQENGMAVQHDGGLGYLNADQSFRLDQTVERVEVVRGGPSTIFAANAPGGVVNFITRKPYDAPEAITKFEVGDYNHYRFDGFWGTPVGEDAFIAVGGFYRENDGVRDPGFTANKGGQIRLSAGKRFEDGEIFADLKHMNDRVAFLLPVPLTFNSSGDVSGVPGFNPNFGTLAGPEVARNVYRNLGSGYDFDLTDGTHTELTQLTLQGDYNLSGWTVSNSFRWRTSDTLRNGLFPTGNIESAEDRLDSYRAALAGQIPASADLEIRYANHPQLTFDMQNNAGNGLVLNGNLLSVDVPLDELINDFRVSRQFDLGSQSHDVAFGIYYADYEYDYIRYMATAMFEVSNQARLLDVAVVNGGNDILNITENGVLRYGSLYNNVEGTGESVALYASDEWQLNDELRIDMGLRHERITLGGQVEGTRVVNLGVEGTLADDQFITGNGVFTPIDRTYNETAWTLGTNYQFADHFGVFARYTSSFRTPNASDFNGDANRNNLKVEPIDMWETGLKYTSGNVDLFATLFRTEFAGISFNDFVFDNASNEFVQRTAFGDTETTGLELETNYRPLTWFDIGLSATIQQPEYSSFSFTEIINGEPVQRDFGGNQLIRVPEMAVRFVPGVNLMDDRLRANLVVEHFSERYADTANSVELPSFTTLAATISYQLNDKISLQLNGYNLTNEIGLTEGNPRAGEFISGDADAEFFLARPILGRSYSASVRLAL